MQDVLERRDLGIRDGFTVVAYKMVDEDTHPDEFDCYEKADVKAWRDDDWSFVGVVVKASKEDIELGEAAIWGFEDGHSPGFVSKARPSGWVDAFDTALGGEGSSYDVPSEAIAAAKETLAKLCEPCRCCIDNECECVHTDEDEED